MTGNSTAHHQLHAIKEEKERRHRQQHEREQAAILLRQQQEQANEEERIRLQQQAAECQSTRFRSEQANATNLNEDNGGICSNMEGVDEYLPVRVMTAEERARHRMPKREREVPPKTTSLLQAALLGDSPPGEDEHKESQDPHQVAVEQEDDVLMFGQDIQWGKTGQYNEYGCYDVEDEDEDI